MFRFELTSAWLPALLVSGVGLMATTSSAAVVVEFQQGFNNLYYPGSPYAGTGDTHLVQTSPDTNFGSATLLQANEGASGNRRRLLLRFDGLGVIGADAADLVGATIELTQYESSVQTPDFTVSVYQITDANAAWTEGGATWSELAEGATSWAGDEGLQASGVDYVAGALDSATYTYGNLAVGGDTNGTKVVWDLPVPLIQQWISGTNAGLMFMTDDPNTSQFAQFGTKEATGGFIDYRPVLTLTFVPEPASLGLLVAGGGLFLVRRRAI